jgi:Rod binding domain-containing protein
VSAISPTSLDASLPPINQAELPAAVRNGSPAAQQAYTEALGFEQVLVNQLTQQLTASINGDGSDDGSDGSDDSSDDQGGLLSSDPSTSMYSSLIPQALTSSIMSAGGLGIASELAKAIDPSFGEKQ